MTAQPLNESVHLYVVDSTHSSTPCAPLSEQSPEQSSEHSPVHYTAQQIAHRYPGLGKDGQPLGEATIRTRWYGWLTQVAPEPLLKTDLGFTQLACDLFDSFALEVKSEGGPFYRKAALWVKQAQSRFADRIPAPVEVAEAELLPTEVTGTLALANQTADTLTQQGEERKAKLLRLIEQARSAESSLSDTQRAIAKQRGINQAIDEYQIELEAKLETLGELRRQLGL